MIQESVHFTNNADEWGTPIPFYNELNQEFCFTLDPCCDVSNHKCEKYFTKIDNGLNKSWAGEVVFCNPPYSELEKWMKKCSTEARNGAFVVLLCPARTDTIAFHTWIYNPHTQQFRDGVTVRFIKGRLKFQYAENSAPFPSMVVIFQKPLK